MNQFSLFLSFLFGLITYQVIGQEPLIESSFSIETKGSGTLINGQTGIECITCLFETVRDNPIHHFAIYSGLMHHLTINESYSIETGIFLEERSFSGGSNTVNNWIVYPKILLTGADTIHLFNRSFEYMLTGGDFWNRDINDMLRIHNLDYQGIMTELTYEGYTFGFLVIGDLSKNVGLGLHQYHKFFVKKQFGQLRSTLYFSDNQLTDYEYHLLPRDYNLGSHHRLSLFQDWQLETQMEFRFNNKLGTSFALGFGLSGELDALTFSGRLKYYQADFNQGYFSNRVRYRGGTSYVGEQLYPLKNYYRAYGQWANYTKMPNVDLLGLELQIHWEKEIARRLLVFTDLDLNIIGNPETRNGRTIPLYALGIKTQYFDCLRTEFFFTNKHMDLDNFYQTFQASKRPFFGGSVILELNQFSLGNI